MRKLTVVLAILLAFCSPPKPNKNFQPTFIVSKYNEYTDTVPPPPPPPAYAPIAFLLDSTGNVYYYQLYIKKRSDSSFVINDDKRPQYLGLDPARLVAVPSKSLESFIQANLSYYNEKERRVVIASISDTIFSNSIKNLMNILSDSVYHTKFFIRMATLEESVVLNYKNKHLYYEPKVINWDSSKIRGLPKEWSQHRTPYL